MSVPNESKHASQVFWQVWTPLVLAIVAMIALAVFSVLASQGNFDVSLKWANISFVFLSIPVIGAGLISLALLAGIIYGVGRLAAWLPGFMETVQNIFILVQDRVHQAADTGARPILFVRSTWAGGQQLFHGLKRDTDQAQQNKTGRS
ncbi:MAG: hypothetical protein GYA17_21395 [Chloroflexi bacterium]|nr:hypothetical protein [Anaerolineaceae bacterium]NMB90926.1 hypothetical protein [Chloroflexota bacterium]